MSVFMVVGIILVTAILILLVVMFLLPTDEKSKKKKQSKLEPTEKEKDLEAKIVHLEKHNNSLKIEIDQLQNQQRAKEKQIAGQQEEMKDLQEKRAQEKSWREKEQDAIDKRNKEAQQFKQERLKLEQSIEEEHAVRLRSEHEFRELKKEYEIANTERRAQAAKILSYETTLAQNKSELAELKRANAKLKEKNEATVWIAKPEYDKLEALLKEKEKEIERLKTDRG